MSSKPKHILKYNSHIIVKIDDEYHAYREDEYKKPSKTYPILIDPKIEVVKFFIDRIILTGNTTTPTPS